MSKELEFEDYVAKTEDSDGDAHSSTVRAAKVTKETEGEVVTRTGVTFAKGGSVLVETDRPGVYDVHTAESWKDSGYGSQEVVKLESHEPPVVSPGNTETKVEPNSVVAK